MSDAQQRNIGATRQGLEAIRTQFGAGQVFDAAGIWATAAREAGYAVIITDLPADGYYDEEDALFTAYVTVDGADKVLMHKDDTVYARDPKEGELSYFSRHVA